jgi:transposase
VHVDETSVQVGTELAWFHVTSTERLTLLHADPTRGKAGVERAGVLPGYTGVAVHDRLGMYFDYESATHAVCGAHLLRNLASVAVVFDQADWAGAMRALLLEMNTAAEAAVAAGKERIPRRRLASLLSRYDAIVADGLAANPDPPVGRKRDAVRRESYNLAVALRDLKGPICLFAKDLRVPFTNYAEVAIMPKVASRSWLGRSSPQEVRHNYKASRNANVLSFAV